MYACIHIICVYIYIIFIEVGGGFCGVVPMSLRPGARSIPHKFWHPGREILRGKL